MMPAFPRLDAATADAIAAWLEHTLGNGLTPVLISAELCVMFAERGEPLPPHLIEVVTQAAAAGRLCVQTVFAAARRASEPEPRADASGPPSPERTPEALHMQAEP